MKKIFITILALAMLATSLTAFAEGNDNASGTPPTQMQDGFGPAGKPMGQPPQGQAPSGEKPGMNGHAPNGEKPGMNGQVPNGEKPGMNGQAPSGEKPASQPEMNGSRPEGSAPAMIDFDAMVTKGVISQETRDRIRTYMEEHKPADLPEMNGEKPADLPEMNGQAPAGEKPADLPEMNGEKPSDDETSLNGGLLADLLKDGVITQAEYDAISAAQ